MSKQHYVEVLILAMLMLCYGCKDLDTESVKPDEVWQVGNIVASADYLNRIADDSSCDIYYRRRCVCSLFENYVKSGMSIRELSQTLKGANWLRYEDVGQVALLGGQLPFKFDDDNTVLMLAVLPENGHNTTLICIKIEGKTSKDYVYQCLRGHGEGMGNDKILECVIDIYARKTHIPLREIRL